VPKTWTARSVFRCAVALSALLPASQAGASDDVLLGRTRASAILALSEAWQDGHDSYEPRAEDIHVLAARRSPATLDVYFGSWCGDSRREVPRLLKILDLAAPRDLRVRFYGVDRAKKEPARLVTRARIERVPTIILSAGRSEVGRIVEAPQSTLEHDLALLFQRIPAEP